MSDSIIKLIEYFLTSAIAGGLLPFTMVFLIFQRNEWSIAMLIASLAFVGACAGMASGISRIAAAGDVIPAFLGLMGAMTVYLFGGKDQSRGIIASLGTTSLSLSLFIGFIAGAEYLKISADHRDIRAICARAYSDAKLLGDDVAFSRFYNQMGNLCYQSMYWRVAGGGAPP